MSATVDRIPVVLLTGFLGSGKTTLLQRLLADPAFARTAVLVNELGAVGLDHLLVGSAAETTRVLENGCVCCSVRGDLASALRDLFWDRLARRVPHFERVVIETTGLADPAPVLAGVAADSLVAERYAWLRVVATVDATQGLAQLETRPEAARQAALADVLLVTKTDLAQASAVAALDARLASLNPAAERHAIAHGVIGAAHVLGDGALRSDTTRPSSASGPSTLVPAPARSPADAPSIVPARRPLHDPRVHTFVLAIEAPVRADALVAALEALAARCGPRLLRAKGIVALDDGRAVVVQMVGTQCFPLVELSATMRDGTAGFGASSAARTNADAAQAGAIVFIAGTDDAAPAQALETGCRAVLRDALDAGAARAATGRAH